jgi:hypothetical protein
LLLIAGGFVIWPPSGPTEQEFQAACGRIGAVMVLVWLAYEQLRRVPRWLWWTFPVLFTALALRPRWLLLLVPLVIALAILGPRSNPRRARRP